MSVQRSIMEIVNRVPFLVAIPSVFVSLIIVNRFAPDDINGMSFFGAYILIVFSLCYIQGELNVRGG